MLLKETPSLNFFFLNYQRHDTYHYFRVKYMMIKSLFHIPRCRRGYLKRFLLSLLKNPLAQDCHWRSYSGIDLGMKNSYFMFIAVTSPRRNISIKCCRVTQPPNNIIQQKPQDVGPPSLGGRGHSTAEDTYPTTPRIRAQVQLRCPSVIAVDVGCPSFFWCRWVIFLEK